MSAKPRQQVSSSVHPTAIIGPEVELAGDVEIGPYCVVSGKVRVGRGCRLKNHVTIFGTAEIGEENIFHPNAVIGDEPQDVHYSGAPRSLRIGNRNRFREGVTVHRGSETGEVTIIGDDNLFMANSHVGHDCRVGNRTIITNGALLGGWAEVGDGAVISGNCAVHQYCRVGRLSIMSGLSRTSRDVPPFCVIESRHELRAINAIGLRRAGMKMKTIVALRKAFYALFNQRQNLKTAIERLLDSGPQIPEVMELVEFIQSSRRGVAIPPFEGQLKHTEDTE